MKKLHPAFHCVALAAVLACGARESDEAEHEATPAAPSAETSAEQPSSPASTPAPSSQVRDKLTCPTGCVKISTAAPSPSCCNCNGQDRSWKRSSWSATTWLCQ